MPSHLPQSTLLKKQPVLLRNPIIIVYRDGSCRIIALIKSQFIYISPSNKMELKQKADRLLDSRGGLYRHSIFTVPMELQTQTHVLSKVQGNVSSNSDRCGSTAGHSCERNHDRCCTQGLTTFLTAGGLYSPEENRLTKQLLFHLLKKTVWLLHTYIWNGQGPNIQLRVIVIFYYWLGKYTFNLYFMNHLLSFNNAKCHSFLGTKLSREFCYPVYYYLQDLKYFPKFYGWRIVFWKTRN